MSVKYDLFKNPKPQDGENKTALHPRAVSSTKISSAKLCEIAAEGSTFSCAEIKGALERLTHALLTQLASGHIVEMGEIGTISLTLKCRPVTDKNEIRAASVHVKDIALRTSKKFKQELSYIRLERDPYYWQSGTMDEKSRNKRLEDFFAAHTFMRRTDYQKLRGCKPGKALIELNELIREKKLIRNGVRSTTVYMRGEKPFQEEQSQE